MDLSTSERGERHVEKRQGQRKGKRTGLKLFFVVMIVVVLAAGGYAVAFYRNDQTEQETGRQARKRRVIQAVTDKALTMGTQWNYQELLQTFAANGETNFQTTDYLYLQRYGYTTAAKNIKQEALGGIGGLRQDRGLLACGR